MNSVIPISISASSLVTACGRGRLKTLAALENAATGLRYKSYPDLDFATWLGQVDGIEQIQLETDLQHYTCRNNQLAKMALDTDQFRDSVQHAIARYGSKRIGLFVGTSTSGIATTEQAYMYARDHADKMPDDYQLLYTHNIASLQDYVQRSLKLQGPGHTISTACSSSAKVFAAAYRHMQTGLCDAAIVGGVDTLCLTTLYGFNSLQLVSDEICRPYDVNRKGINIGEAAGFVLLEPSDVKPGKIKFKGYGETSDAYHMSTPRPDGECAMQAMILALQRAGLDKTDISYVNLHGTATQSNDAAEAKGVQRLFGADVVCSSTKGYTGHTLGAAGITEAMISLLCLEKGMMPGNINLQQLDPDLGISPIPNTRHEAVRNVMSNNFGFGGSNCSLIFGW